MADITLSGLTVKQIAYLGDAAMAAGDYTLARGLYGSLIRRAPNWVSAHTRRGLAQRPAPRTAAMLEVLKALEPHSKSVFVGDGLATWMKDPPFITDTRFMELAEQEAAIAPTGTANWHWNLAIVLCAAQLVRNVPGDFVELGVYKGHTTKFIAEYVDFAAWDKHWWLYDTFDGVPADQQDPGRDITAASYGHPFDFAEVRDRFAPWSNITVTAGRVPEVLDEVCPERIAFMHIDLNNATAEVAALDRLYDRVSPGGVIVFDDYVWTNSRHQFLAEDAWFRARGLTVFPLPTGQGLFIKPLAAEAAD